MSLINTRFQNFISDAQLDKWELRPGRWGFLNLFKSQTDAPESIINDDLVTKARNAVGSVLQVPVLDFDSSVTIQNVTQPVTITGSPSTSQMVTITFVQYYWGFLIHPAQHGSNYISMQKEFNRQMTKYIYEFMDTLDIACGAALELARTQVLNDTLGGRYALTSDVIVGPLAEADNIIGDINVLMSGNDFRGPFDVVGNGSLESHVRTRLLEQGQFNTRDKTYQYQDKNFMFSNNAANGAGHKFTGYAVQKGSVGLLQQFGMDALMGHSSHKHQWGIEPLPIANMPIGTYTYNDAVNGSTLGGAATAHLTATLAEAYGFHTAVAFVTPYNSDPTTRASAIGKFAIATS